MSFLSDLPEAQYREDAFDAFGSARSFDLGVAKALGWMTQLAYETDVQKIDRILARWNLKRFCMLQTRVGSPISVASNLGLVALGRGAVIIAFTGTDPLSLSHWITDLNCQLTTRNLHSGFERAVNSVWNELKDAIRESADSGSILLLTGHSLGGALAAITADRAAHELRADITGLYLFASARPGGRDFATRYTLGERTYRLVHGDDVISAWPTRRMGYLHVGRMLYCSRGKKFAEASFAPQGEDVRDFVPTLLEGIRDWVRTCFWTPGTFSVRSDLIGWLFRLLPPPIGDHIPDRYLAALQNRRL